MNIESYVVYLGRRVKEWLVIDFRYYRYVALIQNKHTLISYNSSVSCIQICLKRVQ